MTVEYSDIYHTANKYFLSASTGNLFPAIHYMHSFYKQADEIKDHFAKKRGAKENDVKMHTVAKMALRKAYEDVQNIYKDEFINDCIDKDDFTEKSKNLAVGFITIQSNSKMREIDRAIKSSHRKTGLKRLAIIPYILDSYDSDSGEEYLIGVKHSKECKKLGTLIYKIASYIVKRFNPAVVDLGEEIIESKSGKRFQYFVEKVLLR